MEIQAIIRSASRLFLAIALFAVFSVTASEQLTSGRPDTMLQAQTDKILAALTENNGQILQNQQQLNQMVEEMIVPMIDFDSMGKLILSKYWKKASTEQRASFLASFQTILKQTYTRYLAQYADQSIAYFPSRTRVKGKYATVYSEFIPGNGRANIPVVYKLRLKNGNWKAYNLVVEGLSFIANYRTDFGREIQATGIDTFISNLQQKTSTSQYARSCEISATC